MPSQEPISPGQIKPESSREPQISSRLQQTNVKLQAPPKSEESYSAQAIANIRAGVAKRMAAQGKVLAAKPVKKARKKISAAGLANIRAAQKARWAKAKAAGTA
jgi:hypothetical protein